MCGVRLCALLRVKPGKIWSILIALSQYESYQWEYFHRPVDAFTCHVEETWIMEEPSDMLTRRRSLHSRRGIGEKDYLSAPATVVPGRDNVFYPDGSYEDKSLLNEEAAPAGSVGALLQRYGAKDIPVLTLVEPLTLLLLAGRMHDIMLLARWGPSALKVCEGWPPSSWADAVKGLHYTPTAGSDFNVASAPNALSSLAHFLRECAPQILAGGGVATDEEHDEGVDTTGHAITLEKHLRFLDAFHNELQPHGDAALSWRLTTGRHKWYGNALLSLVLAARGLKNPAGFQLHMRKTFQTLPKCLRTFATCAVQTGNFKVPAFHRRLALIADVALMLFRRENLNSNPCARFGFADSSEQAGYDWEIVKVKQIEEDKLPEVFEATACLW